MVKAITCSFIAVLAISSVATAQILQYQDWGFGLTGGISLAGGAGAASFAQGLQASDIQNLTFGGDPSSGPAAGGTQGIEAALFQGGSVGATSPGLFSTGGFNTPGGLTFSPGQISIIGSQSTPTMQYVGAIGGGNPWNAISFGGLSIP